METTLGQRLSGLIQGKGISNRALAAEIKVHPSAITQFVKDKNKPKLETSQSIAQFFNVNLEWFLTGKGEISTNTDFQKSSVLTGEKQSFSKEFNTGGNKPASDLFKLNSAQNENEKQTFAGFFPEVTQENYTPLPFIPVSARASFVDRFPDMNFQEMGSFPVYNLSPEIKKKNPVIIEVDGDSMEPQLRSKTLVLAYPVDTGDWAYISGKVVAIVFDNQFTIKRISENTITREGGGVVLKADNGGATLFVPTAAIRFIWQVEDIVGSKVV